MASRFRIQLTYPLLLLLLLTALACGGGGGGGGNNPPTDPGPTLVFLPSGSGALMSFELNTSSIVGTRLTVALDVTSVSDLYGVSFDLSFPADFLTFVSAQEGSHLNASGTLATSFQIVENQAGNLVVGVSRLGDVAGAGGSGRVLLLTFEATTTGEGQLRFVGPEAFDSTGASIGGLTWFGGTVRAVF